MDDAQIQFLEDMISDSIRLTKENEIGQAFDKLARGLESLFNKLPGKRQRDKARALFTHFVSNEYVWRVFNEKIMGVYALGQTLHFSIPEVRQLPLMQLANDFRTAVKKDERQAAAETLADIVLLIRNKRFHGHPEFSARNFRLIMEAKDFLVILSECLQQELLSQQNIQDSGNEASIN